MKKKIFLHIGIGKTGTSSIQNALHGNKKKLKEYGCLYETENNYINHQYLSVLTSDKIPIDVLEKWEKLLYLYNQSDCNSMIISSENLSYVKWEYIKELSFILSKYDVEIIFFIRNEFDLLYSTYLQKVKTNTGYFGDIEYFFEKVSGGFVFERLIKPYEQHFNDSKIVVKLYDKKIQHDVVDDFFQLIGIKNEKLIKNEKRLNETLDIRFYNLLSTVDNNNIDQNIRRKIVSECLKLQKSLEPYKIKDDQNYTEFIKLVKKFYYFNNLNFVNKYLNNQEKEIWLDDKKEVINDFSEKKDLCILHIGMPKTGSTTIQNEFFKNGIEDTKTEYLKLDTPNHGQHLRSISMEQKENYYFFKNKNFTLEDIEDFAKNSKKMIEKSILSSKKQSILMSGEDLYHATPSEIKSLKIFLEKFFKKIVVVAYVRPPKPFCESAFQQVVKFHKLSSFNRGYIYHPYKKIANYINIYGEKNVKILPFIPKKFYNNDLISDFCFCLDLKTQTSRLQNYNETLSKEAISILFAYNKFTDISKDIESNEFLTQSHLVQMLDSFGKEKFKFSGNLIHSWIDQYYKEDFNWLLSRIDDQYREDFLFDPNEDGISSEEELLEYATKQIEPLVELVKDKKSIGFPLEKNPQTVAKLVNIIRNEIAREMGL